MIFNLKAFTETKSKGNARCLKLKINRVLEYYATKTE